MKRTLRARDGKRPKATCERAAERDTQRLFERSNLSLPVKIEEVQHATADASMSDLTTFHVRPQSWVQLLLKECPELLGGSPGDCYSNFECVWKLYEMEHPTHAVFTTHAQHLHSVVPLCIHGDEGRGLKKANYLVMSMQSPLGSTPRPSNRKCDCEARLRDRKDLPFSDGQSPSLSRTVKAFMDSVWCSFRGHSYLSRFLLYGLAGVMCKSHPEVPKAMYALLADDLYELFHAGIEVPGRGRVYGAVIALKGDMDWHKKSLKLTRSWLNAGNESKGQICPHCLAGDINYPFEDYSENPQWTRSFFHSRPWTDGSGDWLLRIPFDAAVLPKPEFIIKGDLFHIMKTGCCRDVIGGAVAFLCRESFFDDGADSKNLPDRLNRAHGSFKLWCHTQGVSPGLHSFSKSFFNIKNMISAPWCNSRGSDTVLLLKWLSWFLSLHLEHPVLPNNGGHSGTMRIMLETIKAARTILFLIRQHRLFLHPACGRLLYVTMMRFLRGYQHLGKLLLSLQIRSFIQKPKLHALHHVAYQLRCQLLKGLPMMNPEAHCCDCDEDFIGRVARVSRKLNTRRLDKRVLQRQFLKLRALINRREREHAK